MLINLIILAAFYMRASFRLQPKALKNEDVAETDNTIELDEAKRVRKRELDSSKKILILLKQRSTRILLVFNVLCIYLLYVSVFVEMLIEVYPDWKPTLTYITFYATLFGTFHSVQTGIYTFAYQ